ncbi:hypothetical protein [Arthrobacter sp. MA-N2]|uniref:hypothetical protein n=1 Tax=Arthrobacter sp. MA-N2 TaxID=1101188 RepID=UPI0012DD46B8|nr:hypothetical protein [Arthrobacter sp. MA-N2]
MIPLRRRDRQEQGSHKLCCNPSISCRHPERAISLAERAAVDYWQIRPDYLGSFAKDPDVPPVTVDDRLTIGPALTRPLRGFGLFGLVASWIAFTILSVRGIRKGERHSLKRCFVAVSLLTVSFSLVQFGTAAFGEAIENTKRMIYGIKAGALVIPLLFCSAISDLKPKTVAA